MILPDHEIKKLLKDGKIVIDPLDDPEKQIQAALVDLRLGNEFSVFKLTKEPFIDIKEREKEYTEKVSVPDDSFFILHPREFVIGITKERIKIPHDIAAYIDGRSSIGRLGITTHITSGYVDPGFDGVLALEITNLGKMPVKIYPGMRICKIIFFRLASPSEKPYDKRADAKYHSQTEASSSKIHQDFDVLV